MKLRLSKPLFLIVLLIGTFIVPTSVGLTGYWINRGGGDNQWLVDVLTICRDGTTLGIARNSAPVAVPLTIEDTDNAVQLLPANTTITPQLQPEPIYIRQPTSDTSVIDNILAYPYYSHYRFGWVGGALDPGTNVDITTTLDGFGQDKLDYQVQDCFINQGYANTDYLGQVDGLEGNGRFIKDDSSQIAIVDVAAAPDGSFYVL